MVYCRYCGAQNRDGDLKCSNCSKPLSLMPNEPQQRPRSSSNNQSLRANDFGNNPNQNDSIKNRYMRGNQGNQNYQDNQNNQSNQNYQNQQKQQFQQNPRDQQYSDQQNYQRNQEYSNNLHQNGLNQQYSQNYAHEPKVSKTAIEWDVVIATALMVIILTAILQRIFPFFAIFISLLLGLAYILIATKSKASLVKSIPLTLLTILAISAYFSL